MVYTMASRVQKGSILLGVYFLAVFMIYCMPRKLTLTAVYRTNFSNTSGNVTRQNKKLKTYKHGEGRLGNLLFQFASSQGIAKHNQRDILFGKEMKVLKNIFPDLSLQTFDNLPKTTQVKETYVWNKDDRLMHLPLQNVTIVGFLCSFRYFEKYNTWLRNHIFAQFNFDLVSKATQFIKTIKVSYLGEQKNVSTICVHVRRGDKIGAKARRIGYRVPSVGEILKAIDYMESKFQNAIFIVASDSKDWCSQLKMNRKNVFISNLKSEHEDFVLMSSCDHMVMTVGTFGWWSGWFTYMRGGRVMYYYHQFYEGTQEYRNFNQSAVFPDDWIAYDNSTVF